MSFLDVFFTYYRNVKNNGTPFPQRGTTNYVGLVVTDDPVNNQTIVAGSSGSGGISSVSGTAPIAVANGTTAPVVSIPPASASTAGSMSIADYNTLHGSLVTSVAVTAPITNSGTSTAPNIGIPASSASTAGTMSTSDFTKLAGVESGAQAVTFAHVNTALAAANADVSINTHKLTNVVAGVASTDAANVGQITGGNTTRGAYGSLPGSPVDGQRYIPSNPSYELISFGGVWYQNLGGIWLQRPPLAATLSTHTNFQTGTSIADGVGGTLVFTVTGENANHIQTAGSSIGAPSTAIIECKCEVITSVADTASAAFVTGGVYMRESGTNKVAEISVSTYTTNSSALEIRTAKWASNTSQTSSVAYTPSNAAGCLMRLRIASGVLYFEVCSDAANWEPLMHDNVTNYFTTAPDEYGVLSRPNGAVTNPTAWVVYPYLKQA